MKPEYAELASRALWDAASHEQDAIDEAARLVADSIQGGGVLHAFGSGHSALVAREVVGRSGSLVPVNQIIDKTEDLAELIDGYGTYLVDFYHQQYQLLADEVVIVISNSGINPLPIEIAQGCKARGLKVVAITNVEQSRDAASRHSSGQRLFEIADVTLDNHAPSGEAAIPVPGLATKIGTVATITGVYLINAIMICTIQEIVARGHTPPIFVSENHTDATAVARNKELRERYQGRLRRAGV
jgi:uncharacterized phosphosugar-binding protein